MDFMRVAWTLKKTLAEVGAMELEEFELWLAFLRDHDPEKIREKDMDARFGLLVNLISKGKLKAEECFPSLTVQQGPEDAIDMDAQMERVMKSMSMRTSGTTGKSKV